ncbi:MAG: UDP-N-acetylmuramoyl-L-alanine--D-glutamate ligase [Deltaproteobacteria bacterium HGW-Deltaproteobacteria-6]|nr:MAG: UDP-N-acetylmuramoyl-L-alanine--D-glutamate ligase [Deltaproteobacteria bacterium HGW-Deltaproteobacteria-6]
MDLSEKKIAVIGMGKTGIAVAGFLGGRQATVVAVDEKPQGQWGEAFEQLASEPWLTVGSYDASALDGVDLVVPSPGIPPYHDILTAAQKKKIPIVSEIELAYRFIKTPIIAVTGTNGKTTTTTLLGKILAHAGKKVFVGGNIGNPLIEYAGTPQSDDFIVAEISSFQLQWTGTFRPHAAILLNITCDHVNYHGSFEAYRRVKAGIFEHQKGNDLAILNADDEAQQGLASSIHAQVIAFSSKRKLDAGIFLQDDFIIDRRPDGSCERYPLGMIALPGLHNAENVMAAVAAARFCGCSQQSIIEAVSGFHGLPHRIEFAGEKHAVKYYDDSKGTNVDAVVRALQTFDTPVILLLGGRDKDGNFEALQPLLQSKTRQVILFGEARDLISPQLGKQVPISKEPTLEAAVQRARRDARPGDIVLLSPGCASFDEFANYKERGKFFKEMVGNL